MAITVAAAVAVTGSLRLARADRLAAVLSRRSAADDWVYACVRHPIYSAILLGGAGLVALGGRASRL